MTIQRMPAAAIVVLGMLLVTSNHAAAGDDDLGYQGKYLHNARFKKIASHLTRYRKSALKTIEKRLGVRPQDASQIRIVLKDAHDANAEVIRPFFGPHFFTTTQDDGSAVVTLHTEYLLNRRYDLRAELTHEMTHAVMRQQMAEDDYRAMPHWLREGLALWSARQIKSRVLVILKNRDVLSGRSNAFAGLESGTHSILRYAEDVLAMDYLAHTAGNDAVKELAESLIEGMPPHEAIEKATGQSWKLFRRECRRYAMKQTRALQPPGAKAYLHIVALDKSHAYRMVKRESARFLKNHPKSILRGDVLYWRGKACRLLRKPSQAEHALSELFRKHARGSSFLEQALYQLGTVRVESGNYRAALLPFKRILQDFPDSGIPDRALYYLALCRSKLGQKRQARHLLDIFERSFPHSPMVKRARKLHKILGT